MKILLILCVLLLTNCDSIFKEDYFLDKKYDLVVGVLNPDSTEITLSGLRKVKYKSEIFVGNAIPDDENVPVIKEGENVPLNTILWVIRNEYFARIVGKNDAKVFVENESGKKIEFKNVGNGFYRDENNELKVEQLKKYKLEVLYDNKTYTGETIVPGNFEITNVSNGDSVEAPMVFIPEIPDSIQMVTLKPTESKGAFFYRLVIGRPGKYNFLNSIHTFDAGDNYYYFNVGCSPDHYGVNFIKTNVLIESIDSVYARIYGPETGIYTGTEEWIEWYDKIHYSKPSERTNIKGGENVAGCFGSINQASVSFVGISKK